MSVVVLLELLVAVVVVVVVVAVVVVVVVVVAVAVIILVCCSSMVVVIVSVVNTAVEVNGQVVAPNVAYSVVKIVSWVSIGSQLAVARRPGLQMVPSSSVD